MARNEQRLIEQKRAELAYRLVSEVKQRQKDYESWAQKLPAMIMTNGLGQTLAFLYSKRNKDPEKKLLYDHLSEWLLSKDAPVAWENEEGDLIKRIIHPSTTSITYRQATQEALAFIGWLKRFAEGLLGEG
jgi:CRISPR-associated protein Cmr5